MLLLQSVSEGYVPSPPAAATCASMSPPVPTSTKLLPAGSCIVAQLFDKKLFGNAPFLSHDGAPEQSPSPTYTWRLTDAASRDRFRSTVAHEFAAWPHIHFFSYVSTHHADSAHDDVSESGGKLQKCSKYIETKS